MAESREFKPLKEAGAIPISDSSELKFYVDEYRGYKYASVRTFVKGDTYSGPTKSGVTLNAAVLEGVIATLSKLPPEPDVLEEKELARFPKKMGVELVVRITIFRDSTGVDLREWVEDVDYKGWSKKGVRIPYKDVPKSLEFLKEMQKLVAKA
ncbi:MAG: hypothetical protein HY077_04880 [Elusimicrobia bacterium]|nr:hypothetical protein [Elusimicrobiota bacterium]